MPRSTDIPIEPPIVNAPGIVRAAEDRSYLGYIAAALLSALAGGFVFAIWIPLASTGAIGGGDRVPWMVQAHGWVQLQGWAGLFVAGMAIRLIPRFAARRPIRRAVTIPLLAALVIPVFLRITLQTWATERAADTVAVAIALTTALSTLGVAAVLAVTLAKGRKPREPWRYFAWAGTAWWAAWAFLALWHIPNSDVTPGLLGHQDNDALLWAVMLGPISNFIWAVQSRSVPVFYGRGTPSLGKVIVPGALFNLGAFLILAGSYDSETGYRMAGVGFAFAGVGLAWLPTVAGSVYGQAKRLRPRARSAALFIIVANLASMAAGLLLVWAGLEVLLRESATAAFEQRDAARHLFGIGAITMLILGMARLVAPFFALERTESGVPRLLERLPFWLLLAPLILRATIPLLDDRLDYEAARHTMAAAGILAWLAIAIFAFSVARAIRAEPRTKRALEQAATRPPRPSP